MAAATASRSTPSAFDAAAYILGQFPTGLTQMKLQKLLYYCQANALVWFGRTLFPNAIEAWANGPVVPDIWHAIRYEGWVTSINGDASKLSADETRCIDSVLKAYGELTGGDLSNQTHQESPWLKARAGAQHGSRSSARISIDEMRDFYVKKWKLAG